MTLRIEKTAWKGVTVLSLCGRIQAEHIVELSELLNLEPDRRRVILDLRDVRLANREAVRFLARCEAQGTELRNCPAFIREWIQKEDSSQPNQFQEQGGKADG